MSGEPLQRITISVCRVSNIIGKITIVARRYVTGVKNLVGGLYLDIRQSIAK